jgi:hypothetical protein
MNTIFFVATTDNISAKEEEIVSYLTRKPLPQDNDGVSLMTSHQVDDKNLIFRSFNDYEPTLLSEQIPFDFLILITSPLDAIKSPVLQQRLQAARQAALLISEMFDSSIIILLTTNSLQEDYLTESAKQEILSGLAELTGASPAKISFYLINSYHNTIAFYSQMNQPKLFTPFKKLLQQLTEKASHNIFTADKRIVEAQVSLNASLIPTAKALSFPSIDLATPTTIGYTLSPMFLTLPATNRTSLNTDTVSFTLEDDVDQAMLRLQQFNKRKKEILANFKFLDEQATVVASSYSSNQIKGLASRLLYTLVKNECLDQENLIIEILLKIIDSPNKLDSIEKPHLKKAMKSRFIKALVDLFNASQGYHYPTVIDKETILVEIEAALCILNKMYGNIKKRGFEHITDSNTKVTLTPVKAPTIRFCPINPAEAQTGMKSPNISSSPAEFFNSHRAEDFLEKIIQKVKLADHPKIICMLAELAKTMTEEDSKKLIIQLQDCNADELVETLEAMVYSITISNAAATESFNLPTLARNRSHIFSQPLPLTFPLLGDHLEEQMTEEEMLQEAIERSMQEM